MFLLVSWAALAAPTRVVTLEDAVKAAAEHPSVRQARASVDAAQARADQAKSSLLPSISGHAGWELSSANVPGEAFSDAAGSWSGSLNASQLLWDFGRTPYSYASSRLGARASEADADDTAVAVAENVRRAYFAAVADKALVRVATETLANENLHLQQVQAFVEVGTRAPIDLFSARTAQANARVALLRSQGSYEQARSTLDQAMGVEGSLDYDVADETFPAVDGEDASVDELVARALKDRPDARAEADRITAEQDLLRSARGAYGPSLSLTGSATTSGDNLDNLGFGLSTGLGLSIPIFDGGSLHAAARSQVAALALAQAQLDALRQQVRVDVEQARVAVATEKAALEAANEAVDAARQQLTLAQGRYETGVGNSVELNDAQLALTNAEGQAVTTTYDLATARAQLLAALGRR